MIIRKYKKEDEKGWVRCRVLSFLDTAYFDDILRFKPAYENQAIQLVAEINNQIVGIIDAEYEEKMGEVCYKCDKIGASIWHLAVMPEYRRMGIAKKLLDTTINLLKQKNMKVLQLFTRDDLWVNEWYIKRGFNLKSSYLHIYAEGEECKSILNIRDENMNIKSCFIHYTGDNTDDTKRIFKRVYNCNEYIMYL